MAKSILRVALLACLFSLPAMAADASPFPNPLKNIKAGQWVTYKVVIMGTEAEQKQSITAITGEGDDRVLTMKVELTVDGSVMQSDEQDIAYKDALAEQQEVFKDEDAVIEHTEVEVKGQLVKGVVVPFSQNGMSGRLYLSDAVPVAGIVKMEIEGADEPVMELKDFGE